MPTTKRTKIHLLYNSKLKPFVWCVKIIGDTSTYGVCDNTGKELPGMWAKWRTKAWALQDSIEQAKERQPSSLKIHKRDGTIAEERSYGLGSESNRKG